MTDIERAKYAMLVLKEYCQRQTRKDADCSKCPLDKSCCTRVLPPCNWEIEE